MTKENDFHPRMANLSDVTDDLLDAIGSSKCDQDLASHDFSFSHSNAQTGRHSEETGGNPYPKR